jgi:hypothetical protein
VLAARADDEPRLLGDRERAFSRPRMPVTGRSPRISSTAKFSLTSAPAARAASTSTRSSSVRRGLHIASTPW